MDDVFQCAVCGAAASGQGLLFVSKRWYFCSQACRITFKRAPEQWTTAHAERGVSVASASALPRTRGASPFKIR